MGIVRQSSFFAIPLLIFSNLAQVHLLQSPASPLSETTLAQMRAIQDASQIYLKDINWIRRDITEGVVHWSYTDFLRDLQVLEQNWKMQKPVCFNNIDVTKEALKQVVTTVDICLKQLEDTVQKAATTAEQVETFEEADNAVRSMLEYKDSRNKKIGNCKEIAAKMNPIYSAEKKNIEACVQQ